MIHVPMLGRWPSFTQRLIQVGVIYWEEQWKRWSRTFLEAQHFSISCMLMSRSKDGPSNSEKRL